MCGPRYITRKGPALETARPPLTERGEASRGGVHATMVRGHQTNTAAHTHAVCHPGLLFPVILLLGHVGALLTLRRLPLPGKPVPETVNA